MLAERIHLEVRGEDAGTRLDRFLALRLEGASRAEARRLIDEGRVVVDDRPCRKGDPVIAGSRVRVEGYVAPGSWGPAPSPDLEVTVLHEDQDMLVVDKPAGAPCHPLRPDEGGTVAGALVLRYPELLDAGPERREAGLVHRLDTETSGVLVFARTRAAFDRLAEQMRGAAAHKQYLALVEGDATGLERVDVPLATSGDHAVAVPAGQERSRLQPKPAVTEVELVERLGAYSLVTAIIGAGRRHQIRAHLAWAGHPVAGDAHYGAAPLAGLDRLFLHAAEVRIESPSSGEEIRVEAPLAPDLDACLAALERGTA